MAERSMEVDAAQLHAGADRCGDAAGMALTAAGRLADKNPTAGMFGDFAEAHAFHRTVSTAHLDHVDRLRGHHRELTAIQDKTHTAAREFTAQDEWAADSLRAVEADLPTR